MNSNHLHSLARRGRGYPDPPAPVRSLESVKDTVLHPGVLFQREIWWDVNGKGHWVDEIDDSYLQNIERFVLSKNWIWLDALRRTRCEHCHKITSKKQVFIPAFGADEEELVEMWLKETPLCQALTWEMKKRQIQPHPR